MIDAGDLVHRITIYAPSIGRDETGQSIEQVPPTQVYSRRAKIEETAGGEGMRGRQVDATTTHLVTIRHCRGVTSQHYVDWGGRRLNITAVLDRTGLFRALELHCKEAK